MKEDKIIKEFRKRFGRFYCDAVKQEVDIEGNLQIGSDDIEDFILEALSQQKQELLKGIEKKFRLLPDCITLGISEKNWNSLKKQLTN